MGFMPPSNTVQSTTGQLVRVVPPLAADNGKVMTYDHPSQTVKFATPAAGGGGPVGYGQATCTTVTQTAVAGGKTASFDGWTWSNYYGAPGLIVPGSFGFGFAAAGWYQVSMQVWAGFSGTTPTFLRLTCDMYDGSGSMYDLPVIPSAAINLGTSTSRSQPGVVATVTGQPFYQDAHTVTGTGQNSMQLGACWDSDGTLTSATGGLSKFAVKLAVSRLS